jgi:hypothetical protein
MTAKTPEATVRRIAIILGSGGSSRDLLEQLLPLLGSGRDVEMQGVFLEEAEVQYAAELPFVQELCRVTFSVREFTSDQFERTLSLRMRSARRALEVLAQRAGVLHSFRNVRGTAVTLLRETASASDITIFEPTRLLAVRVAEPHRAAPVSRRIAVVIDDLEGGGMALLAASHLAEGAAEHLTVLAPPEVMADHEGLEQLLAKTLPGRPSVRSIPDTGLPGLVQTVRAVGATMLVLQASDRLLDSGSLRALRERLHCPICLVRRWGT